MKKTLTAVANAAAIAGGALSGAGIASAAKELGGVNIQRWCASTQHAVLATTSVTRGSGAYSWRCVYRYDTGLPGASNKTVQEGVDMNAACRLQYGNGAWSKPLNPNDANSWRCYR